MTPLRTRAAALAVVATAALLTNACGGNAPPPKTEDTPKDEPKKNGGGGGPSVSQELGSIDERAVNQTFEKLQGKLEGCHKQGRDRVEYLAGDFKVFLRVSQDGKVKWSYFEDSTLGDRGTEKCILELFGATDWPKPQGGEAEVHKPMGWGAGSERPPADWDASKVSSAIDDDKEVKSAVEKCKSGVSGSFKVTAYVEPGEADNAGSGGSGGSGSEPTPASTKPAGKPAGKKGGKKGDKKGPGKGGEHGGKFKTIGIAFTGNKDGGKDAADKVDCIVDAIKPLSLPSPGSYAAKVTFTL